MAQEVPKTRTKTVFKVVSPARNHTGASVVIKHRGLRRFYDLRKVTEPFKGTSLYAFDNLAHAVQFKKGGHNDCSILECEAEVVHEKVDGVCVNDERSAILRWWSKRTVTTTHFPIGALWCKSIKPIRVVDGY